MGGVIKLIALAALIYVIVVVLWPEIAPLVNNVLAGLRARV